jgi:FAD:protein FMN transferase
VDLLARLSRARARPWSFHYEQVLGTSLALRVRASSQASAEQAERAALEEIARLEKLFSSYDPESELRRWQGTQALSPELSALLVASDDWIAKTGGAFHPGVNLGRVPLWRREDDGRFTRLTEAHFTLNAIGKGEIVDRVCTQVLRPEVGVFEVVVNIGGDLCVRGERLVKASVQSEVENAPPLACLWLKNQALATSGTARRGLHLYDPRSGQPVCHIASASVVAPSARIADVLATAFCVLSVEESLALAENEEGVACLLVTAEGQQVRSARWREFEASPRLRRPPPHPKGTRRRG